MGRYLVARVWAFYLCLFPVVRWAAAAEWRGEIVIGPYLQNPATNAMTVIWWTDFMTWGATNRVEYGPGLALHQDAVESGEAGFSDLGRRYKQEARIAGLEAGRTYDYRVVSGDGTFACTSRVYRLTSAPAFASRVHFAHTSDGQPTTPESLARTRGLLAQAQSNGADFILYTGDQVDIGTAAEWEKVLTRVYCEAANQTGCGVGNRIPIMQIVGNHTIYDAGGYGPASIAGSVGRFKAVCDNPDNGSARGDWKERYYAFWYGPCYFICLDANNTSDDGLDNNRHLPDGSTPDWEPGSEQYVWMTNRLAYAQRRAAFTFVAFHPSPYCCGVHGNPKEAQSGYPLRVLDPVFRRYGVDAVFTGHDHVYERCVTGPEGFQNRYPDGIDDPLTWQDEANLNYIVEGNGGDTARAEEGGWETWMDITGNDDAPCYTVYFYPWGGQNDSVSYCDVQVGWNRASNRWRASFKVVRIEPDGSSASDDEFQIERPPPPDAPLGPR
jgi:hypothetical protein